jgi:hypothetical protein
MDGKAKYNWVGGPGIHLMNLISGNNRDGVRIAGSETMSNTISYNLIGLNGDYEDGLANNWYGVTITNSASYNRIGPQNLISGNGLGGVRIYGSGTVSNTLTYNAIGVGLDGQTAIPNSGQGVIIQAGASYNLVGGMFHFEGNWIAGNAQDGVRIDGVNSRYNHVLGNQIGVDITGGVAIPNHQNGVRVSGGASYNSIGGGMPGDGNLISGNILDGIHIDAVGSASDSEHNEILNNIIGVNLTATAAIPNNVGIHLLDGASYTLIGGDLRYGSNLVAGNTYQGIFLEGDDTQNNEIRGNFIGIHPIDFTDLGNGAEGILIDNEAKMNFAGPSNVIAYNGYASDTCGVVINGFLTYDNTLSRNSIFANDIRGICLSNDANMEIDPPVITSAELGSITVLGNACPSCEVELFNSPDNERQGRYYIGSAHANAGGNFTITVPHITYPYLTATTTDASGNTSEFSAVFDSGIQSIFLPMLKH